MLVLGKSGRRAFGDKYPPGRPESILGIVKYIIAGIWLPNEAVASAKALEPLERKAARERKAHDGRAGKLPSRARTRDKVAKYTGRSGRTLEKPASGGIAS